MRFGDRIRNGLQKFMAGRYGPDSLGVFTLSAGIILSLAGAFSGLGIISFLGFGLYVYTLFRMLSRKRENRQEENQKYLQITENAGTKTKQFFRRMKNRKDYRYFKCPQCKQLLRMKRGSGEKEIKCARCGHQFSQKA